MNRFDATPTTRPSKLAKFGPLAAVLCSFAALSGLVIATDPIGEVTANTTATSADRGAETLADIDQYPPGVMPLAKARAEGTEDDYEWGAGCDMETGRLAIPLSPPPDCFAVFKGDNGGATSTGVTADTIKIVQYVSNPDDPVLAFIYGQIGLQAKPGDLEKTIAGLNELYSEYFETYGRKVEIVPYQATGGISDAIAAAADAETIARDIKPFAVFGGPALTNAFGDTLAANKVLCIDCAANNTNDWYEERRPYVWGIQKSLDQNFQMVAEYAIKRLGGRNAEFAGDPKMHDKKRVFAFIHAVTAEGSGNANETFKDGLRPCTTIAPQALTRVATDQEYFPEWIMTGQTLVETTVFSRTYDQKQWAHAFGPSNRFPYVKGGIGSPVYLYKWYFGEEPPAGASTLLSAPNLQVLYSALQGMGPTVTPEMFEQVLFRAPIIPGSSIAPQISFGNRGFFGGQRGRQGRLAVLRRREALFAGQMARRRTAGWRCRKLDLFAR